MNLHLKNILKLIRNKKDYYFSHNIFHVSSSNTVKYGKNVRFRHCNVKVAGKNNTLIFGDNCNLNGLCILIIGENNKIIFGSNVTVNASSSQPTVVNAFGGKTICIGNGSLFSNNIEIHSTDYHEIYDKNGERVNADKDIFIGDNVWVGLGCKILKGSVIPNGCIIGAGLLVSGSYSEENAILGGNPARILKHNVFWKEERLESYPVPDILNNKWNE